MGCKLQTKNLINASLTIKSSIVINFCRLQMWLIYVHISDATQAYWKHSFPFEKVQNQVEKTAKDLIE